MSHSLIVTLRSLTGNPRGCVYTEPLWGIPYNLIAPYVLVYMVALPPVRQRHWHRSQRQLGFSGALGCCSAALLPTSWAAAARRCSSTSWPGSASPGPSHRISGGLRPAGIANAIWRVTMNSWTCLLVEDAEQDQLVEIYTWIHIANVTAGFVAPLAGILVAQYTLVPTMRWLYASEVRTLC